MCSTPRKADAAKIAQVIQELSEQDWLKGIREWWPKYVFHYTDVRNAVEILKSGKLLCRSELDERKSMIVDSASRRVLAKTDDYVRNFVRLYFRPQTPTQYNNEGIRPRNMRALESHCPVPVFFLFDSVDVLTRADSQFSAGNLAVASTILCNTADELSEFDFRKIYHIGPFQSHARDTIIYHRNAEIVIPAEMDLSSLRYIFCRSAAEKDTFLNLLPAEALLEWNRKVLVATKSQFFYCKWTFVEIAELTPTRIALTFSPDTITPGPFDLTAIITDIDSGEQYPHQTTGFYANRGLHIGVPKGVERYNIQLALDDDLAFANDFYGEEIPF